MSEGSFQFRALRTPTDGHVVRLARALALQSEQRPVGGLPAVSERVQWFTDFDLRIDLRRNEESHIFLVIFFNRPI